MLRPAFKRNTIALCMALALGSSTLVGCSKHAGKQDFVADALQYHQQGNDQAAIIQLKNALQQNPNNADARYLLATIYNQRGQGNSAEIELHKALRLGFDKATADAALARALVIQGKFLQTLKDIKPQGTGLVAAEIRTSRGNAYLGLGKGKEAESAFKEALTADPQYAHAYLGLARLAAAHRNYPGALHQIDSALARSPKDIPSLFFKAALLRIKGKDSDAQAIYEQVIKLQKRNIQARLQLVEMDVQSAKLSSADKQIAALKNIAPENIQVRYAEGLLDLRHHKYRRAQDAFLDVLRKDRNYMPAVLFSGEAAYALGSYEQASQYLGQYLAKFPNDPSVIRLQAAIYLQLHQTGEALTLIKSLLAYAPKDPQALALAGQAYLQNKEYSKATRYLANAVAAEPKNASLRAQLGLSRLANGSMQAGIADLESATKIDPHTYKADAILVALYLRNGDYDSAIASAKAWEKARPHSPVAFNFAGAAYIGKKDFANARRSFQHALTLKPDFLPAAMNLTELDLHEGHPKAAQAQLKHFLKHNKDNIQAMIALSDVAAKRGDSKARVAWLNRAIAAHPSAMRPRELLVTYYVNAGRMSRALTAAQNARATNPYSKTALGLMGDTQMAAGKAPDALRTFKRLADLAPNSPVPYYKLAGAQVALHNSAGALAALQKALALKPDFLDAEVALTVTQLRAGHDSQALEAAQQIQKSHPNLPIGFTLEGNTLMAQKHYGAAATAYSRGLKIAPSTALAVRVQQALRADSKDQRADAAAGNWLKTHPHDIGMRSYLAAVDLQSREDPRAIAQYQAILQIQPKNADALNNLAVLYQRQDNSKALTYARQAYRLAPKSPATRDTLGWILVSQGGMHRGLKLLQAAAKDAPANETIQYHYGAALAKSGNKAEARKILELVVKSGAAFPEFDKARALLRGL